jgi:sulfur relay (sulfurtransferase) complex TusBCD TusD component (DsrE family)
MCQRLEKVNITVFFRCDAVSFGNRNQRTLRDPENSVL